MMTIYHPSHTLDLSPGRSITFPPSKVAAFSPSPGIGRYEELQHFGWSIRSDIRNEQVPHTE